MNQYLYAIVDRLPAGWRPPAGVGGAAVVPRRVDDVVVLASALDVVPPSNPRTLALHHDVVASVLDAAATLPFPYGVTVPTAQLDAWLGGHRAMVEAALGAVHGCVEMNVKLLRLDCSLEQPLAGRGRRPAAPAGPDERALRALADALVDRAALEQWRYRPSGRAGNVAASIAFLVPRAEVASFLARIAPVASHATGVAVVPTGPWPPYSFAPPLERAPLVRGGPRESPIDAGRRAG